MKFFFFSFNLLYFEEEMVGKFCFFWEKCLLEVIGGLGLFFVLG